MQEIRNGGFQFRLFPRFHGFDIVGVGEVELPAADTVHFFHGKCGGHVSL